MHVRSKAIAIVATVPLLFLGVSALGEDTITPTVTQEPINQLVPPVEEPTVSSEVIVEQVVLPPPALFHAGCPAGFEEGWSTLPVALALPDGTETNYWPSCTWYDNDAVQFPGCPEYKIGRAHV